MIKEFSKLFEKFQLKGLNQFILIKGFILLMTYNFKNESWMVKLLISALQTLLENSSEYISVFQVKYQCNEYYGNRTLLNFQ